MLGGGAAGAGAQSMRQLPALPDATGWGVHVLAIAEGPDGSLWVGTYGRGIFVLHPDSASWEEIRGEEGLAWDFVNAIAPQSESTIWYGTIGNGFGVSHDGGRSWRNWTFDELGPEWQYVALNGIRTHGDTVYVATADGLRITSDGGATWRCVVAAPGAPGSAAREDRGCTERIEALPNEYLLALDVGIDGTIFVGSLSGLSISRDGGRSWTTRNGLSDAPRGRVRGIATDGVSPVWLVDETTLHVGSAEGVGFRAVAALDTSTGTPAGAPRGVAVSNPGAGGLAVHQDPGSAALPGAHLPMVPTSAGLLVPGGDGSYTVRLPVSAGLYRPDADVWVAAEFGSPPRSLGGTATGLISEEPSEPRDTTLEAYDALTAEVTGISVQQAEQAGMPGPPRRPWLRRPIPNEDANPYIDQTYRYGSTMGGNFQQHQGIEFNNPAGTPVHAIADGTVVFAGPAEHGANVLAIRHDAGEAQQHVFSTYYHNTELLVTEGEHIAAGDVVATVGNTGRATNDHLHLEVHVAPTSDPGAIVDPDNRFPPHTVNPQLWIEPVPGTGVVAGRVLDADGDLLSGARVYGLIIAYPAETPYSFAETYEDRAHADPRYGENFAVGDVPAGDYVLGVDVRGRRLWRRVSVREGEVTWVEFRP